MINLCKRIYSAMEDPKIYRTRGNTGLYPSQASIELSNGKIAGSCHRQIYYQWKGFEPTEESVVDYVLSAQMGEWMHDGIVKFLKDHVVSTELVVLSAEQAFYNQKAMVSGRTDIFMQDLISKELFGVEIKSVGGFAGKDALYQPSLTHLIQSAIYLNEYQLTAAQGYQDINSWIILYISRDEGWDLKARKHNSPFRFLWEFECKFENDMLVVYNQAGTRTEYPDLTISNILNRFYKIKKELKEDTLPDRDFETQYSEETIAGLYKTNNIKFKKDITVVEKWMNAGAKKGELNLKLGDKECMFCSFVSLCHSNDPANGKPGKQKLFNIKSKTNLPTTQKDKKVNLI